MSGYANTENVFYCLNSTFLCRFLLHNYNIKLSSDTFYGGIIVVCAHKNICCIGFMFHNFLTAAHLPLACH